jgi:hypothetical protein
MNSELASSHDAKFGVARMTTAWCLGNFSRSLGSLRNFSNASTTCCTVFRSLAKIQSMNGKSTYHLIRVLFNAESDLPETKRESLLGRSNRNGFYRGGQLVNLSVKTSKGYSPLVRVHVTLPCSKMRLEPFRRIGHQLIHHC